MTDAERQAEFTSFVRTHWSQLMTIAVAVSGSRLDAEDLVQTALANTYGRWPKVREGEALAYLRRCIANAHISRWRRHRGAELIIHELPDAAATDRGAVAVDDRLTLVPLLRELPQTYITSIHVATQRGDAISRLVRQFRNLTIIDTGIVLSQLRSLLDQVSRAVQFVFVFALVAGVLVLYAALSASQDERGHEAALVRAFGAIRRQLWLAHLVELSMLGSMAGLLAGLGASAIGWLLAHQVLHFDYRVGPWPFVAGALLGTLCAMAGGVLALRRVTATPALAILREL